jgi:putative transposase
LPCVSASVCSISSRSICRTERRRGAAGGTSCRGDEKSLWQMVPQSGEHRAVQNAPFSASRSVLFPKGLHYVPRHLVTDQLGSYGAARREVFPSVAHRQDRCLNNRAEVSHQPTRQRERQMRRFKSPGQTQRFLSAHGPINNLFRCGRHLMRAAHYRVFRAQAFVT